MNYKNYSKIMVAIAVLFIGTTACAPSVTANKEVKNIVETAAATDNLSTLVASVQAADLEEALSGRGPLTVFAPTNAAFDALPAGTVNDLLKPENKNTLSRILTYHVVAGDFKAADVLNLITKNNGKAIVSTLSGSTLSLTTSNGKVYVEDVKGNVAEVTTANIANSNGTVHIINKVLMPQ